MYSRFEARLGFMRPYLKRTKIDKKKMNSKRKQALIKKIYFTYLCLKKIELQKHPDLNLESSLTVWDIQLPMLTFHYCLNL